MATNPLIRQRLLKASGQNLNQMGRAALADSAPAPLLRLLGGNGQVNFAGGGGPSVANFSGKAAPNAYAGVNVGNPNTVQVMNEQAFRAPGNTGQLAVHEATHIMQNNLPPKVASSIPADDPNDPYNFGGEAGLVSMRKQGKTLLDLPREQQAAVMQYYTAQNDGYQNKLQAGTAGPADHQAAQQRQQVYGPWVNDLNHVPQSTIMPTDPSAKTINTKVRPVPGPATDIPGATQFAKQTFQYGDAPPGGVLVEGSDYADAPPGGVLVPSNADTTYAPPVPGAPPLKPQPSMLSGPSEVGSVLAQRLKGLVAAPYHAVMDAPRNAQEQSVVDYGGGGKFGRAGLAADRLLGVTASDRAMTNAQQNFKAGNFGQGMQSSMDALPVVGPWARQVEDDATSKGGVAALAGLGFDAFGPQAIAKGAGIVAKPIARGLAKADVTNMIKPSATDRAFGKSPAEGLLNQPGGVFSSSKTSLLDRSKANRSMLGQEIGSTISKAPQTPIDVSAEVNDPFSAALQDAARSNEKPLHQRLQDAQTAYTSDLFHDPSTGTIQARPGPKNLTAMTPSDLFGLKRQVGQDTRWTNQNFDNELNATRGSVYSGLKTKLNNAVPGLKPLNQQYGNMNGGISALERRIPVEERNNAMGIGDTFIGAEGLAEHTYGPTAALLAVKKGLALQPVRSAIDQGLWKYGTSASKPLSKPSPYRFLFSPPGASSR